MNSRMISPWKRPNSANYWFRLAIPPRYRTKVGQSEIKQSLLTSDVREARQLCALLQCEWLTKFKAYDVELERDAATVGIDIVDRFFEHEAELHGGINAVVAFELEGLAVAEDTYLDALTTADILGPDAPSALRLPIAETPYPGYRGPSERKTIATRRNVFGARADTKPLPGREAARRALSLQFWEIASNFIEGAFNFAGRPAVESDFTYAAASERYLRRLIDHPVAGLAELESALPAPPSVQPLAAHPQPPASSLRGLISAVADEQSAISDHVPLVSGSVPTGRLRLFPVENDARTINQVFDAWANAQPADATKLCDEWGVAIRRFVELFGNVDVAEIDGGMVADFRDAMCRLPSRPKRDIAALPILEQIERAKRDGLGCLSGPTVAKLMSGLRVTLAYACDPLRVISHNPAVGVKVANAKSSDDARLPFDGDDLKLIFSDPMIVDAGSTATDAEFWLQVLAPLTGLRIEEMGKVRPGNVRCERGIWYLAIERDRAVRRRAAAEAGEAAKRAKTEASYRHVPLHWLLIEAGFLDFVALRKASNAEWLLDELQADEYGNRTKSASRRLIRHFRDIGISDEEKVFYSFRHTMKRECR